MSVGHIPPGGMYPEPMRATRRDAAVRAESDSSAAALAADLLRARTAGRPEETEPVALTVKIRMGDLPGLDSQDGDCIEVQGDSPDAVLEAFEKTYRGVVALIDTLDAEQEAAAETAKAARAAEVAPAGV